MAVYYTKKTASRRLLTPVPFDGTNGARGGTRTRKDLSTCTSSMRVCQFHHPSRWKTAHSIPFSSEQCNRGRGNFCSAVCASERSRFGRGAVCASASRAVPFRRTRGARIRAARSSARSQRNKRKGKRQWNPTEPNPPRPARHTSSSCNSREPQFQLGRVATATYASRNCNPQRTAGEGVAVLVWRPKSRNQAISARSGTENRANPRLLPRTPQRRRRKSRSSDSFGYFAHSAFASDEIGQLHASK